MKMLGAPKAPVRDQKLLNTLNTAAFSRDRALFWIVLEGVDDECGEGVMEVLFADAAAGGGGWEELLAVLGGVDGDFVGVSECGEWWSLEGVLRDVVE